MQAFFACFFLCFPLFLNGAVSCLVGKLFLCHEKAASEGSRPLAWEKSSVFLRIRLGGLIVSAPRLTAGIYQVGGNIMSDFQSIGTGRSRRSPRS